jgi:hypothetical protein
VTVAYIDLADPSVSIGARQRRRNPAHVAHEFATPIRQIYHAFPADPPRCSRLPERRARAGRQPAACSLGDISQYHAALGGLLGRSSSTVRIREDRSELEVPAERRDVVGDRAQSGVGLVLDV